MIPTRGGIATPPDGPSPRAGREASIGSLQSPPDAGERWSAVGQGRVELPTSRLSGVRSNHLSYWPDSMRVLRHVEPRSPLIPGN